jgi:hypothetical protein
MMENTMTERKIYSIANDILDNWKRPYFGALPYIRSMLALSDLDDNYGYDDARTILVYFLANSGTWRGPEARRIKAEIKTMLGIK